MIGIYILFGGIGLFALIITVLDGIGRRQRRKKDRSLWRQLHSTTRAPNS